MLPSHGNRSRRALWIGLLGTLLLTLSGSRPAYSQGPALEFARFSPTAVFADGVDSTTLSVRVSGPVARVQVSDGRLRADGQPGRFELFDDGTRGDVRAGDQIFTRAGITALGSGQVQIQIVLTSSDGRDTTVFANPDGSLFVVPTSLRREVIPSSSTVQTTPYLVNLRDDGQFMTVGPSRRETPDFPDLRPIVRRFYELYGDDYDFLTVFSTVATATGTNFHTNARNDVQGIGSPAFDNTAAYGSRGRLRGLTFLPVNAGALLHETMHQWGVYLNPSLELGDGTGHWGAVNIPGFLFGLDFRQNANGTYTITWSRFGGLGGINEDKDHRYPPMEQYLMGLVPPEALPDVTVLRGVDPSRLFAGNVVTPTSVRRVTIQDVIAAHGPRIPDAGHAPKQFRMATILLTPGRLANAAEMAIYSRFMEHFASSEGGTLVDFGILRPSFAWATEGRAQIDTTLGSPRRFVPGDLDPSFGTSGTVLTSFGGSDAALALAVQPDGRIVAAGSSLASGKAVFALARYNANGSLDTSFGSGGKVLTEFPDNAGANAVTLQSSGQIVVAGGSSVSGFRGSHFAVARYNADGSLDTSFGSGGKVLTDFGSRDVVASAVAVQPDGQIVVAGYSYNGPSFFVLARYNSDGSLDTSFGTGGRALGGAGVAEAVALQPDGQIVVAGETVASLTPVFALARYHADGSPDPSFGLAGSVLTDFGAGNKGRLSDFRGAVEGAYAVAAQPTGQIVAAGETFANGTSQFALARYNGNGALDTSFGNGGKVLTGFYNAADAGGYAATLQPNGQIVVAGYTFQSGVTGLPHFALARYNADGTLDASFGSSGKVLTDFGGYDVASAVAVQPDGQIVIAGSSFSNGKASFALARYLGR